MYLKQIFFQEVKIRGQQYASFKNIKFPRGNYQTDICALVKKNQLNDFQLLEMKAVKVKCKI